MDDSSCQGTISKSNPVILNYYRQFLLKGFDRQYLKILSNLDNLNTIYFQADSLIKVSIVSSHSKSTKHLITKGWNKQFMKLSQATGSTSNLNKSKLLTLKSRKKEFLVESVQYLILKL